MLSHDQLKSHKVCPCSHATHIGTSNQVPHILEILFFMYEKVNTEKVKSIIDYTLSEEGQKIVLEVGYVPLK